MIFVLSSLVDGDSLLNVGVFWWIECVMLFLIGLVLLIGWLSMFMIWLRVGLLIGIEIGFVVFFMVRLWCRLLDVFR